MQVLRIILYVFLAIDAVALIAVILMQEGKAGGLGATYGENEAAYGANAPRTKDQVLKFYTKIGAGVLFVLCFGLTIIEKFL